jgi:thioesterase domain-containing protein
MRSPTRVKPSPATSPLLCTLVPDGAGAPLFAVPSVGTTPLSLVRLARALAPRRPVHAFAYAGMEDDGPPHATLEAMARQYADEIVARAPRGPYLVAGHCTGGTVALAVALELESRGAAVARVCVLDAVAPRVVDDPEVYADGREETFAEVFRQARRIVEDVARHTLASWPALDDGQRARLAEVLRLHTEAALAFRARPLDAALHVLRTPACHDVVLENWRKVARGGTTRHAVPGDTFSMLKPPHVEAVGRALGSALAA